MSSRLPESDLNEIIEQTREFWTQNRGARVFMTGASGFVGSWLLEVMLHANRELGADLQIVTLSRDPDRARKALPHLFGDAAVRCIAGDVCDFELPDERFDVCLHIAADVADSTRAADHHHVFEAAVRGTQRVLDLARQAGVRRFLFTSSGAIYGTQPASMEHMPESWRGAPDQLVPGTAYAQGKRAAEWLIAEHSARNAGMYSIARIFALLGPRLPLNGTLAAGNFIRDALAGVPLQIRGDGTPVRSYLYMADACVWLLRMMCHDAPLFACNIGSEHSVSIAELAVEIEAVSGKQLGMHIEKPAVAGAPALRYVPATALARQTLGIEKQIPLREALSRTINWQRMATA
jgi:nucleoside-diphosphate-sugar epimerase